MCVCVCVCVCVYQNHRNLHENVVATIPPPRGVSCCGTLHWRCSDMASDVHIKMLTTFLQFSCIFLLLTQTKAKSTKKESLYDENDAVVVLNTGNFERNVFGSETAWFVEFYSHWCGHCVRFSPTWKNVSRSAKGEQTTPRKIQNKFLRICWRLKTQCRCALTIDVSKQTRTKLLRNRSN